MNGHSINQYFFLSQIILGAVFVGIAWLLFGPRTPESGFRVREADLKKPKGARPEGAADLASARLPTKEQPKAPLRLTGIRLDAAPNEILGVSPGASKAEVQKAYRDLMKQYHPDLIGRPGSREWNDSQKIAEAINRAKELMMKTAR